MSEHRDPLNSLLDWRYWASVIPVFLILSYLRQVHDLNFSLGLVALVVWSIAVTMYLEDKRNE